MNYNKLVGWGLIASLVITFLGAMAGESQTLYQIAGIMYMVFGVWGGILLIRSKE